MPKLEYLSLEDNKISEIPYFISGLSKSLWQLYLAKNPIVKISEDFIKLTNLKELSIDWAMYFNGG